VIKSYALFRTAPAPAPATSVTQSAAIGDAHPGQSASNMAEDRDVSWEVMAKPIEINT
jgi:hypothetical protein